MAGRAPVDSPTSTISMARSGKNSVSSRLKESDRPSRTRLEACSTLLETLKLLMEWLAVSRDGTSGRPPDSSVESVLENMAIWYFIQIWPNSGSRYRNASNDLAPLSDRTQKATPSTTATNAARM